MGDDGANNRGIPWLLWEKLSMHKYHGGMGFKDLLAFNLAMLRNQGWTLQADPNSPVSCLFKARYFPTRSYLTPTLGHNPSNVWRSILRARFIVRVGVRWSIDTRSSIPILDEPWLRVFKEKSLFDVLKITNILHSLSCYLLMCFVRLFHEDCSDLTKITNYLHRNNNQSKGQM